MFVPERRGLMHSTNKTKIGENSNQIKTKSKDSFELRASGYEQVHGARGSGLEARGF